MATLINMGQNYQYPMHFLLREYMVIFYFYILYISYLNFCQFIPAKNGCAFIS